MLDEFLSIEQGTYGFSFNSLHQERLTNIYALGWETQTETSYDWDGLRRDGVGAVIFQYTLKGEGEIKIKDQIHRVKPGEAFLVKIPSDHRYRFPEDSDEWELIHITLSGKESVQFYHSITEQYGHILKLNFYDEPIVHIFDLLKRVSENTLRDVYDTSMAAFSFLMKLERHLSYVKPAKEVPDSIAKSFIFIHNQYDKPITLDDIIRASGLSKYYFSRLFQQTTYLSPIEYLTKVRINKAIELLRNKELTIEQIALEVGYDNGNYFNKVFRKSTGLSPGKYRKVKLFMPVDHLITD